MRSRLSLVTLLCLLSFHNPVFAEPLVISGEIQSTKFQMVSAPKTNRWQVFLQWMAEEGEIVEKGELVAVFDSGGVESQLEENKEQLALKVLELKQTTSKESQSVKEAQANLHIAELEVKKKQIEASVPEGQISEYEHGTHQLAYERAVLSLVKAKEQLKLKKSQRDVAIKKKELEIVRMQEDINYKTKQLDKLGVRAEISGPITYALHPWNGKKISAGTNLQASWDVLKVQAQRHFNAVGWVHEADVNKLTENRNVVLSLDAYPGMEFTGSLSSISKQPELKPMWSNGAYYQVNINFTQPPEIKLSPGMSVRIKYGS